MDDNNTTLTQEIEANAKALPRTAWKKGQTGNPNGRPPKKRCNEEKLHEVYREANGDPILLQKLILTHAADLALDLTTALKLAKELSPYEKPKLSSIETKEDKTVQYVLNVPFQQNNIKTIDSED